MGVRGLYNVRGTPTLDIVWLDFEIYRNQVLTLIDINHVSDDGINTFPQRKKNTFKQTSDLFHYFDSMNNGLSQS